MATNRGSEPTTTRRRLLTASSVAVTGAALGAAAPVAAQSSSEFDGWFDGVENYDGVVDRTGQSEVTVEVGVTNGDGPYGFGPPAIRVDPGTTVVWEWTGDGGSHNVVAEDGSYESELVSEAGHTFSHTFEEEGVSKYVCVPHEALGMKGAVVVGNAGPVYEPDYEGWFDDVDNYDGTVDERGNEEVNVDVGVPNGDGPYGFGPAAVRVSPGTTVVWEWTGDGGSHNVVAEDDSFESELVSEAGHTFSHSFEESGVYKYVCVPHEALGMKGAIVVGNVGSRDGGSDGGGGDGDGGGEDASGGGMAVPMPSDFVGWAALVFGGGLALSVSAVLGAEGYTSYRNHSRAEQAYVGDQATEAPDEETEVDLGEEYDPVGTATLVAGYFVLITLLWVFMYFVEFLGGPTITG